MRFFSGRLRTRTRQTSSNQEEINTGVFENYGGDPRVFLIYVCGRGGFRLAPLLCGLAVVRAAFWCSGAVEPLLFTSWPPVRWCGPPRLANFDFRALFLGTLKDFFLLGSIWFEPASWGQGWSLPSPAAWLWAVCGCSPGPAVMSYGSLRLDDIGLKNCFPVA